MDSVATAQQTTRKPVGSYLLRVHEERQVRVRRRYELQDLATGQVLRLDSLAALKRHLEGAETGGD